MALNKLSEDFEGEAWICEYRLSHKWPQLRFPSSKQLLPQSILFVPNEFLDSRSGLQRMPRRLVTSRDLSRAAFTRKVVAALRLTTETRRAPRQPMDTPGVISVPGAALDEF